LTQHPTKWTKINFETFFHEKRIYWFQLSK